jgi:hypothetical protein
MKAFGFRITRFVEWLRVVRAERVDLLTLGEMVFAALEARQALMPATPRLVRERYRVCLKCPVFDPGLKRCRQVTATGRKLGCGCYVPFKAWATARYGGCWGYHHADGAIGWE